MNLDHFSHPHRLTLKCAQTPYDCAGCKERGFQSCYQCKYEKCNFYLHEECARASASEFHPFFRKCDFRFHKNAPVERARYCDACGKDVLGFRYQCLHERAHDLHPCCLKLQRTLKGNGVTLHLNDKVTSRCLHCKSKEISRGVKGWSYVSSCGDYCYHVACVKDIIFEDWKKGHFREHSNVSEMRSQSLPITIPSSQEVVPARGRRSRGRIRKYWRIAKLALNLIISAVFGGPIGLISALAEPLFTN